MDNFIKAIKSMLRGLFNNYSQPKEINSIRDYRYVQKWIKKICLLYTVFSVIALIEIPFSIIFFRLFGMPKFFAYILIPPMLLLTNWGYATLITYLPDIIKSVSKAGKTGYEVGENVETTHVEVTHEFGNSYRVSSYTENKGCLFAFIMGFIQFFIWLFFCVYIGPFLTFKKLKGSLKNVKCYTPNN